MGRLRVAEGRIHGAARPHGRRHDDPFRPSLTLHESKLRRPPARRDRRAHTPPRPARGAVRPAGGLARGAARVREDEPSRRVGRPQRSSRRLVDAGRPRQRSDGAAVVPRRGARPDPLHRRVDRGRASRVRASACSPSRCRGSAPSSSRGRNPRSSSSTTRTGSWTSRAWTRSPTWSITCRRGGGSAIAGRSEPALPFGRYRVQRDLLEIGRATSRWTSARPPRSRSSPGDWHARRGTRQADGRRRTEGWAAGIYLATLADCAGHRGADPSDDGRHGRTSTSPSISARRSAGISTPTITFLSRTSILEIGHPGSRRRLTVPRRRGRAWRGSRGGTCSSSRSAATRPTWRYHNLLREYLRGGAGPAARAAARVTCTRAPTVVRGAGRAGPLHRARPRRAATSTSPRSRDAGRPADVPPWPR